MATTLNPARPFPGAGVYPLDSGHFDEAFAKTGTARPPYVTVIDALARRAGVAFATMLRPAPAPRVAIAAVVDDEPAARAAYAAGVRTLKIKLTAEDTLDRVRAIANAAPGAALRIDAKKVAAVIALLAFFAVTGLAQAGQPGSAACPAGALRIHDADAWFWQ